MTKAAKPRPRSGFAREDQRHTERVVLRLPNGITDYLDELRGNTTRSGYVAWLLSAEMAKRD